MATRRHVDWVALAITVIAGIHGACGAEATAPPIPPSTTAAGTPAPPSGQAGQGSTGVAGRTPTVTAGAGVTAGTSGLHAAGAGGTGIIPIPGEGSGAAGTLPCAVSKSLASNCQKCHGSTPAFGAPMPLVTFADLHKASLKTPTLKVYQVAAQRIDDKAAPMPPGGSAMTVPDHDTLATWFAGGALTAPATEATCDLGTQPTLHTPEYFKAGLPPKAGETCYDLPVHGGQTAGDTTAYPVATGEHYEQFYAKVPWGPGEVMTRFGGKFDNLAVVHHWLLFTTNKDASMNGTHETTIGTTIGDSSQLIGGWAVGGDNVEFPPDMGLELPESGMLNAQWHYYNQGTTPTTDSSRIQVCTVPRAMRKNIASLTFLGTENFNGPLGMPAKTKSNFSGTCVNASAGPITIWGFTPHMHKLGRHMKTEIMRAATGATETVFDKDFDFNSQITWPQSPLLVLQPGDAIISTCTFDNITNASVPFGPSTEQEMCYNFTMSYPAKALDNGVLSLIGATNTCW